MMCGGTSDCQIARWGFEGSTTDGFGTTSTGVGGNTASPVPIGTWFQVSTPIASVGSQLLELSLQGTFGTDADWTGVLYVDDILIQ